MHIVKTAVLSSALVAASALSFSSTALAATWSSSDKFGSWTDGSYTLYNNVWAQSGYGPQTIWGNTGQNWGVWSEQPNTGGIKSYPNSTYHVNVAINSLSSLSSYFDVSDPSSGAQYETAYDIWDSNGDEIMLWVNNSGNSPIANTYGCGTTYALDTACPSYTYQSIGGFTWNVFSGHTDHNVWSFVNVAQSTSGTVDILAIFHWLQSKGWTSNPNITEVQFGWEITSSPTGENWAVNNWDTSFSTGGSGGGGGGSTGYNFLQNRATGLDIDGLGLTANGSNAGQWQPSGSNNQQWAVQSDGSYYRFQNRGTGLYLDGAGRTSNGSTVAQWGSSTSYNQQWGEDNFGGGYYGFYNRATGMMIDGAGLTSNGSNLEQWSYTGSNNQQWSIQ